MKRPFLIAVVVLNLLACALYLWALQDYTTVRLRVQGNTLTAMVNGVSVSATDSTYATGKIALALEDYHHYRAYVSSQAVAHGIRRWLEQLSDWFQQSNPASAWASITVTDLDTGEVLLRSDFRKEGPSGWGNERGQWQVNLLGEYRPSTPGTTSAGDQGWRDYVVEAQLVRGKELAAILVRAQSTHAAYRFWFRPEHGDMGWGLLRKELPAKELADGYFTLSFLSGLKALLREVIWSYLFGLAIFTLLLLLCLPPALLKAKRKTSLRLPSFDSGRSIWIAAAIAVLGTAIATTVAIVLLGRIPHVQDSVTYLFQAKTLALGRLSVPAPPLPDLFEQEFLVVRDGTWFGKYPPGHPIILAMGVLLGVPWLVSPVLGGLSLFLIYLIGRNTYSAGNGLLASFLGLLSPFFIFISGSFMAHPTGMFFMSLFLLSFILMMRTGKERWALVAGFAIGYVAITRQLTALSMALPFGLYFLVLLICDLRAYGGRALIFLVGAVIPLGFLLFYNWSLTGDPFLDTYQLYWAFDKIGFGEGYGMIVAHTPGQGMKNTWGNLTNLQAHLFGWPNYLTLAFLVLPFATLKASRWDWLLLASFLSLMAGYVFYWADGIMFGSRYYYEALPMLLLLTARGILLLPQLAQEVMKFRMGAVAGGITALLMAGLISYNLIYYMPIQWGLYKDYNFVSPKALRLVEGAGLKNALVFVEHEPTWQWWNYGAVFSANSPLLDSNVVYARDLGDEANERLMPFFPGRQYYRLQAMELSQLQH